MSKLRKDEVLTHPLLSEKEVKSLHRDVEAVQKGKIQGLGGSDFWERAKAEMARRQANLQIEIADSLASATWWLFIATLVLAVVTVVVTLWRS